MGINFNKQHKISKLQVTTESGAVIEIHPLAGSGLLELIRGEGPEFIAGNLFYKRQTDFKITGAVGAHKITLPESEPVYTRNVSLNDELEAYIQPDNKWVDINRKKYSELNKRQLTLPVDKIELIWQGYKWLRNKIDIEEFSRSACSTGQLNSEYEYVLRYSYLKVGCQTVDIKRLKALRKRIKYFKTQKEK